MQGRRQDEKLGLFSQCVRECLRSLRSRLIHLFRHCASRSLPEPTSRRDGRLAATAGVAERLEISNLVCVSVEITHRETTVCYCEPRKQIKELSAQTSTANHSQSKSDCGRVHEKKKLRFQVERVEVKYLIGFVCGFISSVDITFLPGGLCKLLSSIINSENISKNALFWPNSGHCILFILGPWHVNTTLIHFNGIHASRQFVYQQN